MDVLVRARLLDDGTMLIAPGAAIDAAACDIIAAAPDGLPRGDRPFLVMLFENEHARQEWIAGQSAPVGGFVC